MVKGNPDGLECLRGENHREAIRDEGRFNGSPGRTSRQFGLGSA